MLAVRDRPSVLVVDDDADVREALRDTLEQEGYRVEVACDGQEALRFLRTQPAPGLILLDWNMAPMNAERFMQAFVTEPFSQVPVVLLTADIGAIERADGHYAGYVKKPVKLDLLFQVVARHLAG